MQIDEQLNVILRGRKFKRMLEHLYGKLRTAYGLRQIEIEIMFYLSRKPEDSVSEISRNLFLNKGYVSQAMNNLCEKDCLDSRIDPKDRRYAVYRITARGQDLLLEAERIRTAVNEQLLRGISEEDLRALERVSAIISGNIEHIFPE